MVVFFCLKLFQLINSFKRTATICVSGTVIYGVVASVYKKLIFLKLYLFWIKVHSHISIFMILQKLRESSSSFVNSTRYKPDLNSDHCVISIILDCNCSHFASWIVFRQNSYFKKTNRSKIFNNVEIIQWLNFNECFNCLNNF